MNCKHALQMPDVGRMAICKRHRRIDDDRCRYNRQSVNERRNCSAEMHKRFDSGLYRSVFI
ncbi:MAG: hypothetical protein HGA81_05335 [Chlorobium limicola]|nr:hypothetical protein [Chlorobium limicola]